MQQGPKGKKREEPRQRKLTYVSGMDGRRYVNDKILRNLESGQTNRFGDYIAYATPEDQGYVPYDPFVAVDHTELLSPGQQPPQPTDQQTWGAPPDVEVQQDAGFQQEPAVGTFQDNVWDQSSSPAMGEAVSISQSEIVAADIQAALDRAMGKKAVHATYHDLSKGAFEGQAFATPSQVEYEAHGYQQEQTPAAAGDSHQHAPTPTGEVHTTHYDGYQDPAYQAVFGSPVQGAPPPLPVPIPASAPAPAPSGSKDDYKKLLGGLFKDDSAPTSEAKPAVVPFPDYSEPPQEPDFSGDSQQQAYVAQQEQAQLTQQGQISHQLPVYREKDHISSQQKALAQQGQSSNQQQVHQQQQQPSAQQAQDSQPQLPWGAPPQFVPPPAQEQTQPPPQVQEQPQPTAKPERIPVKIIRAQPPLPQKRADEVYFEDNANSGKTAIFKMPTEGVVRSSRGTVELLVHKGGRMFRPHYNPVGILLRVDVSDGFSLIKGESADKAPWQMTDRDGNPLDEEEIITVAFDKKGNLWYETVSGKKTKFLVTGAVDVTAPGDQPTKKK